MIEPFGIKIGILDQFYLQGQTTSNVKFLD